MRRTEKVTLHVDLSHLSHLPDDQPFHLKALGQRVGLQRHTAETLAHHSTRNKALAAMPAEHRQRFTHFVEEVELPADAVGFHWIGYPSSNPDAVSDEIAVVFQHVPAAAVRRAVRAMHRDAHPTKPAPALLTDYGVHTVPADLEHGEFHVDASLTVNYKKTALTIVMQHPEIGTLVPDMYHRIAEQLVVTDPNFSQLWQYLSTHPQEGDDPWYVNTYAMDPHGNPMEPDTDLTDKDGQPVVWPTKEIDGKQVSVIPQQRLSDGLAAAATPVVQSVGKAIKQQPWLKGQQWSTQPGVTVQTRTNVPSTPQPMLRAAVGAPPQPDWAIVNKTSQYGLDLYADTLKFDAGKKTLSFDVKNWPNRGLGAYVQFLDANSKPIDNPQGWDDRLKVLPKFLHDWIEPSSNKWYLQHIGAGNVFYGVPVWTDPVTLSFTVPDQAIGANVLIGGLGNGHWDMDVDLPGLLLTCVSSYGIPSVLSVLSVGAQSTKWYMEFFEDSENVLALVAVGFGPFSAAVAVGSVTLGVKATLSMVAEFVAGIIFNAGLKKLALRVTGYVTAMELAENAPYVGWALRIASLASSVADMLATSIEVALSPATYTLEAKRSMTLHVTVKPDPTHGTATQKPIWPKVSDHYIITVQYQGGTTLRKSGPMPGGDDTPIDVTFEKASSDALPSAPGQKFQILAEIYSASNWICGKWVTGWIDAVPTDGDGRTESGSIIEQLVPLTPTTRYSQEEKLTYDGTSKAYVWQKIIFAISDSLESSFKAGAVPQAVSDAFWANGVRLSGSSSITVVDPTGRWQVIDTGNGVTYNVAKRAIVDDQNQPIGYELAVSNATHPAPTGTATSLPTQDVRQLVNITINDLAYKVGYSYQAQNQNLPLDYSPDSDKQSTPMYVFESISTLAHPDAGMKSPTRGFSLQPYIAYDQFGPAGIFQLSPAATYLPELNAGGKVPADVSAAFTAQGFPLPDGAVVTVVTADAAWQIGLTGQSAIYDLRREVDIIKVFRAPAPAFSPNNFYLDSRTYQSDGLYHLRLVKLDDDSGPTFDYDTRESWGAFDLPNLDAISVHPNGYVIGISYRYDKMAILKLPDGPMSEQDAPRALPFSGTGVREGLMRGPVGMTVTADGRILILERDNARIQAFDTQANPVQCFAEALTFDLASSFAGDLNQSTVTIPLVQELQKYVTVLNPVPDADDKRLLLTPAFSMDESYVAVLNAGTVTDALRDQFHQNALDLGQNVQILTTAPNIWLIDDQDVGLTYDVRFNGESLGEVDVYRGFAPTIAVKSPNSEWTLSDKTNTLVFDIKQQPGAGGSTVLHFQRLVSYMKLKGGPSDTTVYVDVASETKGFIYVLSYVQPGDKASDYRLDLYNPDGTPVTPDVTTNNGQINAARMTVDQWRTVFSLNYEQMQGPGGRPEPTISQWIPSTPTGP